VIIIEGKCSNLVVTKCCNIVLMVDEIAGACTVSESEQVSIVVRGTFPSPLTIRCVNGLCLTCGQNNVHSSVSGMWHSCVFSFETCISSNVCSVPHCDPQFDFFFAPAIAVSRGIGVEIHGMVRAGQLEPPFPQVSKRMPIDVWEFEALLRGNEGQLPGPYAARDIEM
jgi:hypothetical protein